MSLAIDPRDLATPAIIADPYPAYDALRGDSPWRRVLAARAQGRCALCRDQARASARPDWWPLCSWQA